MCFQFTKMADTRPKRALKDVNYAKSDSDSEAEGACRPPKSKASKTPSAKGKASAPTSTSTTAAISTIKKPLAKARSQYVIYRSLVASSAAGKKLGAKELTALVKETSTKAKSFNSYYKPAEGSDDERWLALWTQAAATEVDEAASVRAANARWATDAAATILAQLETATSAATPGDFAALELAVTAAGATFSACVSHASEPLPELAQALARARASLAEHKSAAAGDRAAAVVAACEAAVAANTPAALGGADAAAAAWLQTFGDIAPADAKERVEGARASGERAATALRDAAADDELVASLRDADESALRAHAAEVRELRESVEQLQADAEQLRREQAAAAAAQRSADAAATATAARLPGEIGRALQSQLVYYQGLKYTSKTISYTCGGVSDAVFQAAFQGVRGASVVVAGGALGVRGKSLRYGAYLDLVGGVTIKLTGSTLTAKAAYTMRK